MLNGCSEAERMKFAGHTNRVIFHLHMAPISTTNGSALEKRDNVLYTWKLSAVCPCITTRSSYSHCWQKYKMTWNIG